MPDRTQVNLAPPIRRSKRSSVARMAGRASSDRHIRRQRRDPRRRRLRRHWPLTFLFAPWFAVLGLMVVAFSRAGLRYEFRTWPVRAAINIALVVGALAVVTISKRMLDLS